ncbi:hypothetical protein LWI29_016940 [Acer saccharum]|uniref:Uncharacterized protein n=1 Tax=Acer saccharum TaxID=4024 RepID=A0AA39SNH9_ACESA|nr:hypothetical protein LWI29_016940 [Acer saccharum]
MAPVFNVYAQAEMATEVHGGAVVQTRVKFEVVDASTDVVIADTVMEEADADTVMIDALSNVDMEEVEARMADVDTYEVMEDTIVADVDTVMYDADGNTVMTDALSDVDTVMTDALSDADTVKVEAGMADVDTHVVMEDTEVADVDKADVDVVWETLDVFRDFKRQRCQL